MNGSVKPTRAKRKAARLDRMMPEPAIDAAVYAASATGGVTIDIMQTGWQAFRFALVGFTLPFMFVLRPQLLVLDPEGGTAAPLTLGYHVLPLQGTDGQPPAHSSQPIIVTMRARDDDVLVMATMSWD